MRKILIILLAIIILSGCTNTKNDIRYEDVSESQVTNYNNQKEGNKDSTWYSSYSLETDRISIAVADYTTKQPHKKLKPILDITDAVDIKLITDEVDFSSWEKVLPENEAKGEPYFYIIFNNGTMISMYSDIAYGGVKEYIAKDGFYTGVNYSGHYNIPKDFLTKVWQFVEPYKEILDVEK